MDTTAFQNKMNEIQEKIGQDASSLIMDDIGLLLSDNKQMNETISEKNTENENLKKTNETLQMVNGNLLKQVGMIEDTKLNDNKTEEKPKEFDFRTVFDEKGNFKK